MAHLDAQKPGRIPRGAGQTHSHDGPAATTAQPRSATETDCTYLHSAVDRLSRLADIEARSDELAVITSEFFCRDRTFFATHGSTGLNRLVTDNGVNHKARNSTSTVAAQAG